MNVLSLFDGLSCGQIALNKIGIKPTKYYAAEIDKYAIKVTQANYPNTIQLGDVTKWQDWDINWSSLDLVTGGFPCQAWSMAGKQLGDKDERGMLFWTMLDIMQHAMRANPKIKFLIENVKMKKEFEEYITHHTTAALGHVEKILINSALVSAQNRNRYYWTNWKVSQPEDKGIVLADVIEGDGVGVIKSHGEYKDKNEKSQCIDANYHKGVDNHGQRTVLKQYPRGNNSGFEKEVNKAPTMTANSWQTNVHLRHDTPQRVATASDIKGHDYNKRVYSPLGKSPTLAASSGGNLEPKVLTVELNDRIKGVTEDKRGIRFHKGDAAKSGISELGRILKPEAGKTDTLTTSHMPKLALNANVTKLHYRKLTPTECERLQTVPDGYTDHVSNTQRYKMLGNGWTVDVIAHIYSEMELPIQAFARQLDLFGEVA
ncbi:MAG: DNA (cytosine-5-)-methyltransferase [Glaciecola sp.]|jgi:DNA (cytosine-5)-methyltransferase 1/DNA (cytosine-5)-methyltransferase 3A